MSLQSAELSEGFTTYITEVTLARFVVQGMRSHWLHSNVECPESLESNFRSVWFIVTILSIGLHNIPYFLVISFHNTWIWRITLSVLSISSFEIICNKNMRLDGNVTDGQSRRKIYAVVSRAISKPGLSKNEFSMLWLESQAADRSGDDETNIMMFDSKLV